MAREASGSKPSYCRTWREWAVGVFALLVLIGAVLPGCGDDASDDADEPTGERTDTAEQPQEPDEPDRYRMTVRAQIADGTIEITGSTNLPDDARIDVGAARVFRYAEEDEIRTAAIGKGQIPSAVEATVEAGAFTAEVPLDESLLASDLANADEPDPLFGPIAVVDSHVTVCAIFRTGRDLDDKWRQPSADVRGEVGDAGEALEDSPGVDEFGGATDNPSLQLETRRRIEHPVSVMDDIVAAQGTQPRVRRLDGFCSG